MELHQVRYFLALAQSLNFTRAAEACNVTQPALTKAIQRLEAELGGPLLLRERSLTRLTPLGEAMLPLLEASYQAAEAARAQAASFGRDEVTPLRIGLTCSLSAGLLAPVLDELTPLFQHLELTIERAAAELLCERLREGTLDVAVMRAPGRLPERLHRWTLYDERLVLLMPAGHGLAAMDPVPASALAGLSLIGRDDELDSMIGPCGARRHRAGDEASVQALVALGLGCAVAGARTALAPGLVARPLDLPAHPIVLATVAGRPYGAAVDGFVRLARARSWELAR
jgi:DNA-binding transcriptional LysR family regulator